MLVHSSGNAHGQAKAGDKRLARAAADLDKVAAGAGDRYYGTEQKNTERVGVIRNRHRVTDVPRTDIGTYPATGKPTLTWWWEADLLAAEAAAYGWYSLLTSIGPEDGEAAQILRDYKGQPAVERRYSEFKGPLAVAPMFLHDNKRITALVTVICLALLVFCLIERQVRQALGGDQKMIGLYPDNGRIRPTGRMILRTLAGLTMSPPIATGPPTIHVTRGVQTHLFELIGIDQTRPRQPAT